ncbi:MAG: hypothetical protein AAGA66_21350 [Bacteroidota bacterium]
MSKPLLISLKLCLIFFSISCTENIEEPSSNQLLDFWQKKITLSSDQQKQYALENIASSSDGYLKAISHFMIGYFNINDGEYSTALMNYLQAEQNLSESGMVDNKLLGHIYREKAFVFMRYKLYEKAFSHYDSALSHYSQYPDDFAKDRLTTIYNQGLALSYFNYEEALERFQKLQEESQLHEDTGYELKALAQMGQVYVSMTDHEKAEVKLNEAIGILENPELEDPRLESHLYQSLSRVYFYAGNYAKQETYLRKSIALTDSENKTFTLTVDLGESLMEQGKKQEALTLLTDLEKEYEKQPLHPDNFRIYELLGQVSEKSARTLYQAKEQKEQAKYDQKKNAIVAQEREENVQLMAQQLANKRLQEQLEKAVFNERASKMVIFAIFIMVCIYGSIRFLKFKSQERIDDSTIQVLKEKAELLHYLASIYKLDLNSLKERMRRLYR